MTLNKQIMLFISGLIFVLLMATFFLNVSNTKTFLQGQLVSHSEDSATTLGLSLSSIADLDNPASIEAMINAVFDRGQYALIAFDDMDGERVYARQNTSIPSEVPVWFSRWVSIDLPSARAMVQSGWMPMGELIVQAHSGYAYVELWGAVKRLFVLFVVASFLAVFLAFLMFKAMLKPLKRIEEQADAIVRKEFVYQENIPKTIEFQRVVLAMNDMVSKLKDIFERDAKVAEKLQRMAYQDSVTGLSNRQHFEMVFESYLAMNSDVDHGSMVIFRIDGMKELNDHFGYEVGNHFMSSFATGLVKDLASQDGLYARLNGLEMVAVIPNLTVEDIQTSAKGVMQQTDAILSAMNLPMDSVQVSTVVLGFKQGEKRGALLSKVELAMQELQAKAAERFIAIAAENLVSFTDLVWENLLEDAFEHQRFLLYKQASFGQDEQIHDTELFIKMRDKEGVIRSAAYFMPAVAKAGLLLDLDLVVIDLALKHQQQTSADRLLAINLSHKSLVDSTLFARLLSALESMRGKNLAFEFSDAWVSSDLALTMPILQKVKAMGFEVGIDQFGSQFNNMQYLLDVRPNYIKLDAAFSQRIVSDEQTQSYVTSLCELAGSLDIPVIGMAIETQQQLDSFKTMGVKYFQGYLFGTPSPL
jgi:diguanylate cyclase (GGDEF)-like protein